MFCRKHAQIMHFCKSVTPYAPTPVKAVLIPTFTSSNFLVDSAQKMSTSRKLLQNRIREEGQLLPGKIIKVDCFLKHRVDTALMSDIADEFAKHFDISNITLVLTTEVSGIALATVCVQRYGVPMVFAKKAKSGNI